MERDTRHPPPHQARKKWHAGRTGREGAGWTGWLADWLAWRCGVCRLCVLLLLLPLALCYAVLAQLLWLPFSCCCLALDCCGPDTRTAMPRWAAVLPLPAALCFHSLPALALLGRLLAVASFLFFVLPLQALWLGPGLLVGLLCLLGKHTARAIARRGRQQSEPTVGEEEHHPDGGGAGGFIRDGELMLVAVLLPVGAWGVTLEAWGVIGPADGPEAPPPAQDEEEGGTAAGEEEGSHEEEGLMLVEDQDEEEAVAA